MLILSCGQPYILIPTLSLQYELLHSWSIILAHEKCILCKLSTTSSKGIYGLLICILPSKSAFYYAETSQATLITELLICSITELLISDKLDCLSYSTCQSFARFESSFYTRKRCPLSGHSSPTLSYALSPLKLVLYYIITLAGSSKFQHGWMYVFNYEKTKH